MRALSTGLSRPFERLSDRLTGVGAEIGDVRLFASNPGSEWLVEDGVISASPALLGHLQPSSFSFPTLRRAADTASFSAIAYGNGIWIIAGSVVGTWQYSTDNGVTWIAFTGPVANPANVRFINGFFYAPNRTGTQIYRSADGINWTLWSTVTTSPAFTALYDIAYGMGMFVVVGNGSASLAYSTDNGATWTTVAAVETAMGSSACINVVFGYTLDQGLPCFVCIGASAGGMMKSYDGITWTNSNLVSASSTNGASLAYARGTWVFAGLGTPPDWCRYSGEQIQTGVQGSDFVSTGGPKSLTSTHLRASCGADGTHVVAGQTGFVGVSLDGRTWTTLSADGFTNSIIWGIGYANGRLIAAVADGRVYSWDVTNLRANPLRYHPDNKRDWKAYTRIA